MTLSLNYCLMLSMLVFALGLWGMILNRSNLIKTFLCLDLMVLAAANCFVSVSCFTGDITGQIFALFIIAVAAVISAVGLALLLVYYRASYSADIKNMDRLKG